MSAEINPQMSEKTDIILAKLMKAKKEIGAVKKDSKNPFHKSNYASLNAYIDACENHLMANGLILVQAGNGSFSEPVIIATLIHPESGQWIKSYFPILNPKQDSQGLGAAVTYMRRYSISTLLGLKAEDDDGETAVGRGKYKEDSPKQDIKSLLTLFDKEDHEALKSYMKAVMNHWGWDKEECIDKMIQDKTIKDKFETWKKKNTAKSTDAKVNG